MISKVKIDVRNIKRVAKFISNKTNKSTDYIVFINDQPKYEISERDGKTWSRDFGEAIPFSPLTYNHYANKTEISELIGQLEYTINNY
jgi:hypothetical protein